MKYKIQENIIFIHLGAIGQYLLTKLEKEKLYKYQVFRKLPVYCIELPTFSVKLPAFNEKSLIVFEFFKIKFYEVQNIGKY